MEAIKKENIYLDLSKLSGEEIKSLPNIIIESGEFIYEMTENMLNTGGLIDEDGDSSYILLAKSNKNEWIAYLESGCEDKTEISLSEFRQLFSKGEEVLQVENNGWIKIESEADLPEQGGSYYIARFGKVETAVYLKNNRWIVDGNDYPKTTNNHCITHYQKIQEPKPPKF